MKKLTFDELFVAYDKARLEAQEAEKIQNAMKVEIKERLEEKELDQVDTEEFVCTYYFDKDKEVFDEVLFAKKEPKKFKAYTDLIAEMKVFEKKYTKKKKGARKLLVNRKNEQEENS